MTQTASHPACIVIQWGTYWAPTANQTHAGPEKNCSDLDSLGGPSELIPSLSKLALPRAHCSKAGQQQTVAFQATRETGYLHQRRERGGEGLRLNGSQETVMGMFAAHHCDRKNKNILFFLSFTLTFLKLIFIRV